MATHQAIVETFRARLERVLRRNRRQLAVFGVSTLLTFLGVFLLAFCGLDVYAKMGSLPRWAALLLLLAGAGALVVRMARRYSREARAYVATARRLENRLGEQESVLHTAAEFTVDTRRAGSMSSPEQVEALVGEAERRSEAAAIERLAGHRGAGAWLIAAALVLAVFAALSAAFPRLSMATVQRLLFPWKPVPPPTLVLLAVEPGNTERPRFSVFTVAARPDPRSYTRPDSALIEYAPADTGEGGPERWRAEPMQVVQGGFAHIFKRLDASLRYRIRSGDFVSPTFVVTAFVPPRVKTISLGLEYPEYTGLGHKRIDDALGPISALRGTRVTMQIQANTELGSARVEFDTAPPVDAAVSDDRATAQFTIERADRYRIRLVDKTGHTNDDAALSFTINAEDDKPPTVRIVQPGINLKLSKTAEVPISLETDDDFGVSEAGIACTVKTDAERRFPVAQFEQAVKRAQAGQTLYLEEMGLADTDIVTYYAYAVDNDAVSGPKEGVSGLYFIEIRPYAQQYREAGGPQAGGRQQGQDGEKEGSFTEKLDAIIEKQKQLLTRTFDIDRQLRSLRQVPEPQQTAIARLESQQNDLRQQLYLLARSLAEKLIALRLQEHLDRLESLWKARNEMVIAAYSLNMLDTRNGYAYENQSLYHLYRAKRDILQMVSEAGDAETRKKLEQALEQSLEKFDRETRNQAENEKDQLREHAKRIEQLVEQQARLNDRLREHARDKLQTQRTPEAQASRPSPQRAMQDTARRQAEVADQALQEHAELQQTLQYAPRIGPAPARELARSYYEMTQTHNSLLQEKPDEARDHGIKAQNRLQESLDELKKAMQRSTGEQLDNLQKDAARLAEKQQELARQPASQPGQDEQARAQQKELNEDVSDLAQKLQQAGRDLAESDPDLGRKTQQAGRDLQSQQMRQAQEQAEQPGNQPGTRAAREQLSRELQKQADKLGEVSRDFGMDDAGRLEDAHRRARDLARREKAVEQALREQKPGDTGQAARTAGEQQSVEQATEDLARKLDRVSAAREADLADSLKSSLDKAVEAMKQARKQAADRPQDAAADAAQAQGELRRVEEALQRLLAQSLNRELADAAEAARQALESQKGAQQSTRRLAQPQAEQPANQQPPAAAPAQQGAVAAQQQQAALDRTRELAGKLDALAERSARSDPVLARRVQDAAESIRPEDTMKDMEKALDRLSQGKFAEAIDPQAEAARRLDSGMKRLNDTLQDRTPLLAQKLKNLQEEASRLQTAARDTAARMAEQQKQEGPPSPDGQGRVPDQLKAMQDRAAALSGRVGFLGSDAPAERPAKETPDQPEAAKPADGKETPGPAERRETPSTTDADRREWRQVLDAARKELQQASESYAKGDTEQAAAGLKRASKGFQVFSEGVIAALDRLTTRQQRGTPALEVAPAQYRSLVEEYYRALSEEK